MHEHVFIMTTEVAQNYPEAWGDEDARVADAITRLNELKSRGVDTIVDLTVIGLGRYIPRIARVAAATELNIVVATGLYTYNDVPFCFHYLGPGAQLGGPEIMTDMFVRDIEQGIADTGIKAGILKCATDEPGITPGVERVLRAVAQAHKRTGVPISTHTHAGLRRGLEQQRIFEEEGVDLSRVIIGHSGDSTDIGYLEELIAGGSYLGMDRFGIDVILPFEERVNIVAQMCERGHADKMVLSHDANCYFDALPEELLPVAAPNWHYLHIHNDVIPAFEGTRGHRRAAAHHARRQPAAHLRATGQLSMTQSAPVPPIGTQISALAELAPDEPAVTCDGRTLTRGELDRSTNRLARAYAERGVGVGDYVTIVLPNSVECVQAMVACWKLGAVPQPLSARLPDAEFEGLLELRPRALLVGRTHPGIPSVPTGFVPDQALSDDPLPEAVSPCWRSIGSGGSTGRPKLIEAGGDSRLGPALGYAVGGQEGDTVLVPVPLTHTTGFTSAAVALVMGNHLVLMSRFDPHEFLRLITEHRPQLVTTVPTMMQRALPVYRTDPDSYDLSSIRRFWHLGAPCPPAIKQAWIDLLGPERVWELYGGTEFQAMTFISGDQWLTHPRIGRCGGHGRDEGARRRRQPMPARRGRRDLHAAQPGQRADVPVHRHDGEIPRRLGLVGRPWPFRRGRVLVPVRSPGRHVHRRRPQRLPGRDRERAVGASGCAVLLGCWRTP